MALRFGVAELKAVPPPRIEDLDLRPPRIEPPAGLADRITADPYERALHTYGKSLRDIVRVFRREFGPAPDLVAYPTSEEDVVRILDWCADRRVAVVPFGGGSSVVGGVEPAVGDGYAGTLSLDLGRLDRVLEIDRVSRAARIQAGVLGPALEAQLRPHGLTLRHFPQSFQYSSLGGWIATRSGGHYATLYTHIDEFVEGLRVVTARGVVETRRLPASGAGPAPDRLFIGSEGILGVITEAWMRLQDRPRHRAMAAVFFPDFLTGARAVRALAQSGLFPANCRLLDPHEAGEAGAGDGTRAVLVLGFESADHPVDAALSRALELCRDFGGEPESARSATDDPAVARTGSAGAWRDAFLRAPYAREVLVPAGVVADTYETAVTWDRFEAFYSALVETTERAIREISGHPGWVACRFTHVYPDGPAPYFSFRALTRPADTLAAWEHIKTAVSEAIVRLGGTITHHHAVGRDHRRWYDQELPPLFRAALRAAKAELDPRGILNPGVLVDPA
ncbi:MAG: FAD-binding oxidoreductase [Actinomycetia bacterium]|nr:FAD-binding oxidoreductase [Actinomycetes bacterium]